MLKCKHTVSQRSLNRLRHGPIAMDSKWNFKIRQIGDPVLRTPAQPVPAEDIERVKSADRYSYIRQIVGMMTDIMREASGVGLAAPQIGIPLQIIVMEETSKGLEGTRSEVLDERERVAFPLTVLINPRIKLSQAHMTEFFEGCLSIQGYQGLVRRHHSVVLEEAIDQHGNPVSQQIFKGWPARILQHEYDHLQGVLFTDRMRRLSFIGNKSTANPWHNLLMSEIYDLLDLRQAKEDEEGLLRAARMPVQTNDVSRTTDDIYSALRGELLDDFVTFVQREPTDPELAISKLALAVQRWKSQTSSI